MSPRLSLVLPRDQGGASRGRRAAVGRAGVSTAARCLSRVPSTGLLDSQHAKADRVREKWRCPFCERLHAWPKGFVRVFDRECPKRTSADEAQAGFGPCPCGATA